MQYLKPLGFAAIVLSLLASPAAAYWATPRDLWFLPWFFYAIVSLYAAKRMQSWLIYFAISGFAFSGSFCSLFLYKSAETDIPGQVISVVLGALIGWYLSPILGSAFSRNK